MNDLRAIVAKKTKTLPQNIVIHPTLNQHIWARGAKKPTAKVKVALRKDKEKLMVYLEGNIPVEKPKEAPKETKKADKKPEKKEEPKADKKEEPKKEAKTESKAKPEVKKAPAKKPSKPKAKKETKAKK